MRPLRHLDVRPSATVTPLTPDVLCTSDNLKVLRIDAVRHTAQMVERHPVGDESDDRLVDNAMRPGGPDTAAHLDDPVAAGFSGAGEAPAPLGRLDDLRENSLVCGAGLWRHQGTWLQNYRTEQEHMNYLLDTIRAVWATNPVRVTAVVVYVVTLAAAKVGLSLDTDDVAIAAAVLLPVLLGGEVTRANVSPYQGEIGPANDDLLPDEPR
jgi:hypothetical protein